jgi:RND family efflux transporter MFP subunit
MRVEEDNSVERQNAAADVRSAKTPGEQKRPKRGWLVAVIVLAVAGIVYISGVLPRVKAREEVRRETEELAIPTVSVVHPKQSAPMQEIVLPANVQPYISSPIFARTNGYLKRWYADIGAHVKKGQLLAEIETPEVDQQLQQARANLATAEANLKLAEITANRYQGLLKSDSVAQQDTDNAVGTYNADKAIVAADQANVRQLEQLQSFEKIYAPFDGVITVRNTDIGALINSGSGGGPQTALFQIAQPGTLRVYVNVPEAYSQAAKPGMTADLVLSEFPGKRFQGKLVRTAGAIDPATRTLLIEVDVPNPSGTLLSGAYAELHMKLPTATSAYMLPVNTLLFRQEGLRVVAVGEGGHVQLKPLTLGHDFGNEVEVIAGLDGTESIIVNPPDSIEPGQVVKIVTPPPPRGAAQGGSEN